MDTTDSAPTTIELRKSYDDIPYANVARPFTHISRLAAVARLRGMNPVSPEACRVLELGCADGGNLLPMAIQFRHSQFVGIDLSPVQVDMGREMSADLSVSNLELRTGDILELGDDLEHYDYIIAHGVYSWVPSEVRAKILSICQNHLTENGLAYISYNTYPGWHGKQALQKMLRYHTRRLDDPREKVKAALSLLAAFPTPTDLPNDPSAILVQRLRHDLENIDDPVTYLVHEYLVDDNQPIYLREFLDQVEAFDLQYVDDAFPGSASVDRMPPAAQQWVGENVTSYAEQQQYVDYFCNTAFRRSLLCRAGFPLEHDVTFDRIQSLYVTATCRREESDDGVTRYRNDPGRIFSIQHPGLQKVLDSLVEARPTSISVSQLRQFLGKDLPDDDAAQMFDSLLRNASIEITSHPHGCVRDIGESPFASNLVRFQSATGTATNAAHRPFALSNPLERSLVPLLDGTRTVKQLISTLQNHLTPDPPLSEAQWETLVQDHLAKLARNGLLTSPEMEQTG